MLVSFSPCAPSCATATFTVDLVYKYRLDASAGKSVSNYLPLVYATHSEFLGSILAVSHFMRCRLRDGTPQRDITKQLLYGLFGQNADKAAAFTAQGFDDARLTSEFERVLCHLKQSVALSSTKSTHELLFLKKYF